MTLPQAYLLAENTNNQHLAHTDSAALELGAQFYPRQLQPQEKQMYFPFKVLLWQNNNTLNEAVYVVRNGDKMKSNKLIGITTIIAITASAHTQADYRAEVTLGHLYQQDSKDFEFTNSMAGISYYLNPVKTQNTPYAESEFMSKASGLHLAIGSWEVNHPLSTTGLSGSDFAAGINLAGEASNLTFSTIYTSSTDDDGIYDEQTIELEAGKYMDQGEHFGVIFQHKKNNVNTPDYTASALGISYKSLFIDYDNSAISTEFKAIASSKYSIYSLTSSYYFTPAVGINGGLEISGGDKYIEEGATLSFGSSYFFTPTIAAEAQIKHFSASCDSSINNNSLLLFVSARR